MIRSMTAYTRQALTADWGHATFEIRSLNHRYLETLIRLPERFRGLEGFLRDRFKQAVTRGKIECQLHIELNPSAQNELVFNEMLAKQLISTANRLKGQHSMGELSPIDILRWPGVIVVKEQDLDHISSQLLGLFDTSLAEFVDMREREGESLKMLIIQRLQGIELQVATIMSYMPAVMVWQKEKLASKLSEAGIDDDNNRFEQEIVLIAQRIDVAEELDRLSTHVKETYRILEKGGAVGRRLDFMMQEFNRESNTIASKSINSTITASAIELKVLIEQMREQIQNIE